MLEDLGRSAGVTAKITSLNLDSEGGQQFFRAMLLQGTVSRS